MSGRSSVSAASSRNQRFEVSFSYGARQRYFTVKPVWFFSTLGAFLCVSALYLGAACYLFLHDDLMSALMARQARQQYAYEDRLAALRLQLDRVTSRQMLDQDSFEGKVRHLVERQAQLETRTALVASLTDRLAGPGAANSPLPPASLARAASQRDWAAPAAAAPLPMKPTPEAASANAKPSSKPKPESFELRSFDKDSKDAKAPAHSAMNADGLTRIGAASASAFNHANEERLADMGQNDAAPPIRLSAISASLDVVETRQLKSLSALSGPMAEKTERLKTAFAETGLPLNKFLSSAPAQKQAAVGGPFIPAKTGDGASAFDKQFMIAQNALATLEKLRQVLPRAPVRKPLEGALEVSSTFGYRMDPFLGRPALHSGLDLKADSGAPVYATAGGKVVTADASGGYGNLVEIEHAPGVATRYGHLSAILVRDGETVAAGALIGRVGSTGRSTGPHLHYEVRLDDEATDPARFIRAAKFMSAKE